MPNLKAVKQFQHGFDPKMPTAAPGDENQQVDLGAAAKPLKDPQGLMNAVAGKYEGMVQGQGSPAPQAQATPPAPAAEPDAGSAETSRVSEYSPELLQMALERSNQAGAAARQKLPSEQPPSKQPEVYSATE